MESLLELRRVYKGFSGIKVLKGVSLDIKKGQVVALAGENGAGKSTLMRIIAGIYERDAGDILFHGQPVKFSSARQSIDAGISIIHQELNLIPEMTVGVARQITIA